MAYDECNRLLSAMIILGRGEVDNDLCVYEIIFIVIVDGFNVFYTIFHVTKHKTFG